MWLCRIELNVILNPEENTLFLSVSGKGGIQQMLMLWIGLDWQGGIFCVILIVCKCLEVDSGTSSKLSICFKYSVTGIRLSE